jgi:hypothetical protein
MIVNHSGSAATLVPTRRGAAGYQVSDGPVALAFVFVPGGGRQFASAWLGVAGIDSRGQDYRPRQVVEVAVADVLAERAHDTPRVVMRASASR